MANRRRGKFRLNKGENSEPENNPAVDDYAKDYEPNPVLKQAVKWVLIALLLFAAWTYFSQRDTIAKIQAEAAKREQLEIERERREVEIGRKNSLAFEKAREEALQVFNEEKYFEAAFKLRNALTYDGHNIELRQKLLTALEKSCENGNEMHCRSIEKEKQAIKSLKNPETEL
ncbi:MAG: hypothetical protein AAF990_03880 [Bacteroidota bacterium]